MRRFFVAGALLIAASAVADVEPINNPEGVMRSRGVRPEPPLLWSRPAFSLTPKLGIGAPVAGLPFSPRGALELAYAPPLLGRQLFLALETSYSGPSIPGRYTVGGFNYSVNVDQLELTALASWHWLPDGGQFAPYLGVGGGLCATRAATAFDDGSQRAVRELRPALVGLVGAQIQTGLGTVELELRGQRSPSRTEVLKGSSIAPLTFTIGYRFPLTH